MIPLKVLDGVGVTGPSNSIDIEGPLGRVTMVIISDATGGPGVNLEASMDDSNWFTVATTSSPKAVTTTSQHNFRYWRANVTSAGDATSIDAWLNF